MRWSLVHQSNKYRTNEDVRRVSIRSQRHSKAETVDSLDKWSPRNDRQLARANCTQYWIWTRSNCSICGLRLRKWKIKKRNEPLACVQGTFTRRRSDTCRVILSGENDRYYSYVFVRTCSAFKIECSILYSFAFLRIFAVSLGTRLTAPRYSWAVIIVIDRNVVIAVVAHFICRGRVLLCQHRNRRNEFMYRACDATTIHDDQMTEIEAKNKKKKINKLPMMSGCVGTTRVHGEHFALHTTEDQANATVGMQ